MKRRLTLKSEHLTELTGSELSAVAGGLATERCFTGVYPTINTPCPTTDCIYIGQIPTLDGCFTGTSLHTVACA